MRTTAIILAAGQGKRMKTSVAKQYLMLKEKPVLFYSIKAFELSDVDEIILVTGNGQVDYCRNDIVYKYDLKKVTHILEGGKERYDSVYRALCSIDKTDYVFIHDGARPFISSGFINRMIQEVSEHKACITATPVKETIKIVDEHGYIVSTPDRNTLWSAQTPQAFDFTAIRKAYEMFFSCNEKTFLNITDDAMVYEKFIGEGIKIVQGDYNNIKLTTEDDYLHAKILVESYDNICGKPDLS